MKTLVTGEAGFIGGRLTEILVKKGYNVTVLDSLISRHKENLKAVQDKPNFMRPWEDKIKQHLKLYNNTLRNI